MRSDRGRGGNEDAGHRNVARAGRSDTLGIVAVPWRRRIGNRGCLDRAILHGGRGARRGTHQSRGAPRKVSRSCAGAGARTREDSTAERPCDGANQTLAHGSTYPRDRDADRAVEALPDGRFSGSRQSVHGKTAGRTDEGKLRTTSDVAPLLV